MSIQPGDVFVWEDFDGHADGSVKDAWFISVGKTGIFSEITLFYMLRTTTQLQYYLPGCKREKHLTVIFDPAKTEHSMFESKCLVDLTDKPFIFSQGFEMDISFLHKGRIPESDLKNIFSKLLKNRFLPKKDKLDIRDSFRSAGIKGLPDL